MPYTSAFILLLSLASQTLALPVAQPNALAYDDGFYHPPSVQVVAPTSTSTAPPKVATTIASKLPTSRVSTVVATASVSLKPTQSTKSTFVPAPTSNPSSDEGVTVNTPVQYKLFKGDGSVAAGWPAKNQWVNFEQMWTENKKIMAVACEAQGVENNDETEMAQVKDAIIAESKASGVDKRFILATIMEESTGCVRVKSTTSPDGTVFNPGLMQDHNGAGTCAGKEAPCPKEQIALMIKDGTSGTAFGDGLKQTLGDAQASGAKDATAIYIAARLYNSGNYEGGPLEGGRVATACYTSDIANLLLGFANAASPCKKDKLL